MKIIRGIKQIRKFKKPVVALGVFDGVHRGHIRILKSAVRKAHRVNGTSVVLTFWPHPQMVKSIYSLEHRLRLISQIGIDVCIVVNFNKKFANISAFNFVKHILVKKIGAYAINVGDNFRFGKNAQGDIKTLKELARLYNFRLKAFKVIRSHNQPINSTSIRLLIKKGDLVKAQGLLSRPVAVLGTVTKGVRLGRRLGFPTANIDPHHEVIPPSGIYAVKINFKGKIFLGACYIGTRPTLNAKNKKILIEVFIFGLNKNIYGEYLEIQFIRKIREDRKFASLLKLAIQIEKDILKVKKLFPASPRHTTTPAK